MQNSKMDNQERIGCKTQIHIQMDWYMSWMSKCKHNKKNY